MFSLLSNLRPRPTLWPLVTQDTDGASTGQPELATACNDASTAAIGDEVPAPAVQSVPAGTDGLLPGAAVPIVDEEFSLEKRKRSFGLSPPKLGRDKKPRSRAPSVESVTPAVGSEEGATNQPVVVAAEDAPAGDEQGATKQLFSLAVEDDRVGSEEVAAVDGNSALNGKVSTLAEGELPPSARDSVSVAVVKEWTVDENSPLVVEQTTTAVDAAVTSQGDGAAVIVEPLEEMAVPVLASGGVVSDTTEKGRLVLEVANVDEGMPAAATAVPAVLVGLDEPTSSKKNAHHRGFSLSRLFSWDKKDKPRSRATSVENAPTTASEELSQPQQVVVDGSVAVSGGVPSAVAAVPVGAEDGAAAGGQAPIHPFVAESGEVPPTSIGVSAVEAAENPPAAAIVDGSGAAMISAVNEDVSDAVEIVSDAIETAADQLVADHVDEAPLAATEATEVEQHGSGKVGSWP